MRYIVLAIALFFAVGCEENNYYYGFSDGGAVEAAINEGEMANIWTPESKIFGQGTLTLQPAPAAPAAGVNPWPFIRDTPAMQGSQTLLDLATADAKPHVATMTFGLSGPQPPPNAMGPIGEVVALVNLGVGGVMIPVEVDVVQGFQWSLSVNRVQVHLVYRVVPGSTAVPVPTPTYTIGASVSGDVIAHGRQPQRTLAKGENPAGPTFALAPGGQDWWRVPAFAKSFKVTAVPNNSSLRIMLAPVGVGIIETARYDMVAYPSVDLPVPSDSFMILVWNTGLVNVDTYRLVFDLAL